MADMKFEKIKECALTSTSFHSLVDALEDILKADELKNKLNNAGAKLAFTELFFREFVNDKNLMMRNITNEDLIKRIERHKNEFGGIMLKWVLNEKDPCFTAIVKMVTEAKELVENIDRDNISAELGRPAKIHSKDELKEMLSNETFRSLHSNDNTKAALLDYICVMLPDFKEQSKESNKTVTDITIESIKKSLGSLEFDTDVDEGFFRNILDQVQDLPTEEAIKKIQNIITGLKNKNTVRTLEDAFNVAGFAALLISIAEDNKGLITNKETFKGVTGVAIRKQIGNLPKNVIFDMIAFCAEYYDNFTEEGKAKFISNINDYIHEISGDKDLLKNTVLDNIASGKGAMVIDNTGDIEQIKDAILNSLDIEDDEDDDDDEEDL